MFSVTTRLEYAIPHICQGKSGHESISQILSATIGNLYFRKATIFALNHCPMKIFNDDNAADSIGGDDK